MTSDEADLLATIGVAVGAIEVAALVATGGPDWGAALLGLALAALAGWRPRTPEPGEATSTPWWSRAAERERQREERARRATTDERLRIARELHDVVAHAMSIIAVRSGVARMALDTRPQEAREALGIIEDTSRQALQELRTLVGVLRGTETDTTPAQREPAPGLADLEQLVTQIGDGGVSVDVHVEGEPRRLPPGVDLSAYRIVQEALTNVVRHAAPATAELTLRYLPAETHHRSHRRRPDPPQTSKADNPLTAPGTASSACANGSPSTAGSCRPSRPPPGSASWLASPAAEAAT